jgi:hypothetical protein
MGILGIQIDTISSTNITKMEVFRCEKWRFLFRCAALLLISGGILTAFAVTATSEAEKKKEKRTTYGTGVETGFRLVRYHDTCILFRAFFISGDFFSGLSQVDTQVGRQFEKKKQIYRTFPNTIIVDVQADAVPCDISPEHVPPADTAVGLLGTLSFGTNWKVNNPDLQLTDVVPTKVEHLNHGIRWNYFLEIPAKDIPLTAELAIGVTARDHIQLTAFSAHL